MIADLYAHQEWADAAIWQAALANGPDAVDGEVLTRLRHAITVQCAFLAAWRERPFVPGELDDFDAIRLLDRSRRYHAEARAFSASPGPLDRPLRVPWQDLLDQHFGRQVRTATLAETLIQVAAHSTYHRGQINMRLRQAGSEPPLTDYIVWIWLDRPAADWPA